MEPKFKTSFIPKKNLTQSGNARRPRRGNTAGVFLMLTGILAILTLALAGGIFLYQQYLERSIESKSDTLERARAAFEPALIQELVRLDKRLDVSRTLLHEHISPTTLFATLEAATLPSVRFLDFDLSEGGNGRYTLSMSGEARNFNSVALQADNFGTERLFRDPIFSGLNVDQNGNVVFDLTMFVDADLMRYVDTQAAQNGGAAQSL